MNNSPDRRPDPEELLKQYKAENTGKGRLKIFVGYAAGVGKTYAMLTEARRVRDAGIDVVAGYIEAHARPETTALLEGLEILPPRRIDYRGLVLFDFDLDATLTRKPLLVLVDELAHTNAPGLRHAKRWQDVRELLDTGIDVFTTLNVQHLESLSDVVVSFTGVVMTETVPDSLFDEADRIEVVDIPPEELLERFREGKIYVPAQAATAMSHFFQRPKLVALREITLRRTAEQMNNAVQNYHRRQAENALWATSERLLVCVGHSASSATVVRKARRMASTLRAHWIALHIRPAGQVLNSTRQATLRRNLQIAEDLGAEVVVVQSENRDAARSIVEYARLRNVTKIIIGKNLSRHRSPFRFRTDLVDRLLAESGDSDVYVIPGEPVRPERPAPKRRRVRWIEFAGAAIVMALAGLLAIGVDQLGFGVASVVMVLLLGVVISSLRFGRAASVAASIVGVLEFNFFFTQPLYSFAISDTQNVIIFFIMLAVALVLNSLTSRVRRQARVALDQEWRTDALFRLSGSLSRATGRLQIVSAARQVLDGIFKAEFAMFLENDGRILKASDPTFVPPDPREEAVVAWVLRNGQAAGQGTGTLSAADALYLPFKGSHDCLGVMGIRFRDQGDLSLMDVRNLLDAFVAQIAVALEREELSEATHEVSLRMEGEQLRIALLRSVSHDLRTPLAGIAGSAGVLSEKWKDRSEPEDRDLLDGIAEEAAWMTRTVDNLLSLTRFESEKIVLRKEPETADDVISSALRVAAKRLAGHPVAVSVPPEILVIPMESVLIEQVLVNLLDNAAKYSGENTPIDLIGRRQGPNAAFEVADRGPGIPPGEEKRIFEKFHRLAGQAGLIRGNGLGLAICKAIVEAHGGGIEARRREGGGSRFIFTLPLDEESEIGK